MGTSAALQVRASTLSYRYSGPSAATAASARPITGAAIHKALRRNLTHAGYCADDPDAGV